MGEKGKNMNMKNFLGNKGIKMRLVSKVEGRGKWCLQQYFVFEISRISERKMSIAVNIWTEA